MRKQTNLVVLRSVAVFLALVLGSPAWASPFGNQNTTPPLSPFSQLDGAVLSGSAGTLSGRRALAPGADTKTPLADWWNGKTMLGGYGNFGFDARRQLADRGFVMQGFYQGAFFGVLDSEKGSRGFWDQQLTFGPEINLGKALDNKWLDGVFGFGLFRYRDSAKSSNPNNFVEAQSMFNPSNWQSGTQFRVLAFGLEAGTAGNLPIKDQVVVRAGWLQPQKDFIDQPLSKLFLNNAVNSAKGVGGNIPFSSSFSTWGGVLKLALHETVYVKNGLYMSFPQATASTNHGLAYQGFGPDTSRNGLFYIGETGWTPTFTESKLPGKFAFGGYFYGTPANLTTTWNGIGEPGQYGFYFQADQMLYREPSAPATSPSSPDGKSFAAPVAMEKPKLSPQGLSAFNLITMAPGYAKANNFPFYFQSGLVYTGLVPTRDQDLTMASIGYGAYQGGVSNPSKTYTAVVELGYRYQINGWAYAQPFFQYFARPNGTQEIANAAVLGFLTGVVF